MHTVSLRSHTAHFVNAFAIYVASQPVIQKDYIYSTFLK